MLFILLKGACYMRNIKKIYHLSFVDIFWRRGRNHNIPEAYCQLWELQVSEEMAERVGCVCPSVMNHYLLDSMVGNPKPLRLCCQQRNTVRDAKPLHKTLKRAPFWGHYLVLLVSLIRLTDKVSMIFLLQHSSIFTQVSYPIWL